MRCLGLLHFYFFFLRLLKCWLMTDSSRKVGTICFFGRCTLSQLHLGTHSVTVKCNLRTSTILVKGFVLFFQLWKNVYNIKFTILTIFKCRSFVVLGTFTLSSPPTSITFLFYPTETTKPLNNNSLFFPSLSSWQPPSYFLSVWMWLF